MSLSPTELLRVTALLHDVEARLTKCEADIRKTVEIILNMEERTQKAFKEVERRFDENTKILNAMMGLVDMENENEQ